MSLTSRISRRQALIAGASLPLAASFSLNPSRAMAAAEMKGPSSARFNRFNLGSFEVTVLLGGSRPVENPQTIFGMNVSADEFASVSAQNFIPADKTQFFFTPTLVNTGTELVLFDTGLSADSIVDVLAAAGYTPDQIDVVVLTHMHGDHIGGMAKDGVQTFPNARVTTGAVEFAHWEMSGNETFEANVMPLQDQITYLKGGGSVASGITAIEAFGHTPGHMAYMLESDGQQLVLIADAANHYVWSLAQPDWEVKFDVDKAAAAATRRSLLGMIAADKIPFVGYHMPFPAMGFVEAKDSGFRYVPASYQLML